MIKLLTLKKLRTILVYNKKTGLFTNRYTSGRARKGNIRGSVATTGYIETTVDYEKWLAHRLAFLYVTGKVPDEIDHINGIRTDNRWSNLRAVTSKENSKNMRKQKHNTSGCSGVDLDKRRNKWRVRIGDSNKKGSHVGYFDTYEDAVTARKLAEKAQGYSERHGS